MLNQSTRLSSNVELKRVDSQKDLGVIVTGNLLWNSHVDSISAKANKMLGFLKRNCSKEISSNALKALYLALVRSHLGYCGQIWAPQSVIRNILLVEAVQRTATKFICKLSKTDHYSYRDRLVQLNLLPLSYWLEYLDLVFFFKCKSDDNSIKLDKYMSSCPGTSRRSSTGLYRRLKSIPKTSTFRDSLFSPYCANVERSTR